MWKAEKFKGTDALKNFTGVLGTAMTKAGVPSSWAPYLTELFARESGLNFNAKNPNSTAHGIAQFLNSTRADYEKRYGIKYDTPLNQLILGIKYVTDRYKDPVKALAFWDKNNWY